MRPHNVDINSAVLDIAKLLRPTLGEQIEIDTMLGKDVKPAHIDPSQLANAVINMAINARDAMPNGGKLLLETAQCRARREPMPQPIRTSRPALM